MSTLEWIGIALALFGAALAGICNAIIFNAIASLLCRATYDKIQKSLPPRRRD
jgi:hypothetical protein